MEVIHYLDPLNQRAVVEAVHSMFGLTEELAVRVAAAVAPEEMDQVQSAVKEMLVHLARRMQQTQAAVAAVMVLPVLSAQLQMAALGVVEHQIQFLESVLAP